MLKTISRYSTILMPICSFIGFLFPALSNQILLLLPSILFFLMFFTLLGIDQKALLKKTISQSVWVFAIFQNLLTCLLVTALAYALGARGTWLLAISAVGATAPLFGSGAIVNAMGFDALLAMAKTISATLLLPVSLFIVLFFLGSDTAQLDLILYSKRLIIYIICPILLAIIIKKIVPSSTLQRYYPKVSQFNVLLILLFPLGLMGGYRDHFNQHPALACLLFLVATGLVAFIFGLTYLFYKKTGYQNAVIASTVSSGRNVLLTYTIATPFLGELFLPLIGAMQLPMFSVPFFGKLLITKHQSKH